MHENVHGALVRLTTRISSLVDSVQLLFLRGGGGSDFPDVSRYARFAALLIAFFFGVFGVWAAFAPLSGSVVAPGYVEFLDSGKVVQVLDGGLIGEILVKDGDLVSQGQTLMRFDDTDIRASSNIMRHSIFAHRAAITRLQSELRGAETLELPEVLLDMASDEEAFHEVLVNQGRLFDLRKALYGGREELLFVSMASLEKELEGVRLQLAEEEKRLTYLQEEISGTEDLVAQGFASKRELINLEGRRSELLKSVVGYEAAIARLQEERVGLKIQALNLKNDYVQQIEGELLDAESRLIEMNEKYHAIAEALGRTVVLSPRSGIVTNSDACFRGRVVAPGAQLMKIIATSDQMVIKGELMRDHISALLRKVKSIDSYGQDPEQLLTARVKLLAYKGRWSKPLEGKVIYIAADSEARENGLYGYYYPIKILIDEEQAKAQGITLYPGMAVEIYLEAQKTTMLSYWLEPIIGGLKKSLVD